MTITPYLSPMIRSSPGYHISFVFVFLPANAFHICIPSYHISSLHTLKLPE